MGIRHLETFMKNDLPYGFTAVDIKKEIKEFQRKHNIPAVIVIDLMGLLSYLGRNKLELLCGGRHKRCSLFCDQLFQSLKEAGAELVFFEDGVVQPIKHGEWCKRQDKKYEECLKILNLIYQQTPIEDICAIKTSTRSENIPLLTTMLSAIEESAKQHGKLIKSISVECDLELAEYATRTNAMAVMADDSDFLIFPGNWVYWSIKELNNVDLTTQKFDRSALRAYLKLSDEQMPIFATIAGNDTIPFEDVQRFHKYLGNTQSREKFPNIAKYVSNNFHKQTLYASACEIAEAVLRDSRLETVELVLLSLKSYDLGYDQTHPFRDNALLMAFLENNHNFAFEVLRGSPKSISMIYFDMKLFFLGLSDMPMLYSDLALALYQRQIGVLLDHQKAMNPFRTVFIKMNHETNHQSINVIPIFPPEELVPPLQDLLILQIKDDRLLDKKWTLLKWMINADNMLLDRDLKMIPKEYLTDILVLVYLVENKMITVEEADVILMTINFGNLKMIPFEIVPPKILNQRAFRITFLFTKIYNHISKCLSVAGLRDFSKVLDFDGVFFHWMHFKYICDGCSSEIPSQLLNVANYRLYDIV